MTDHNENDYTKLPDLIDALKPHDHLCLIYESREEWLETVVPFISSGLKRGEKCIYVVDANTAQEMKAVFREAGMAVDNYESKGQLSIIHERDAYTREGFFDPDLMISLLIEETEQALREGYPALRVTGEMSWALRDYSGTERVLEYEAKLNKELFPAYPCVAICQYDRWKFDPDTIKGVVLTHPLLIRGGQIYRNFYYIEPDEYLNHKKGEREVQHWLNNLERERKTQESLLESEERSRAILSALPDLMFVYSRDGYYLDYHASEKSLLYVEPGQFIGKSILEVLPKEVAELFLQGFERVYETNQLQIIDYVLDLPVGLRHFEARITLMDDQRLVVIVRDITERKQAEQELHESEEKHRRLFETMAQGVIYQAADGKIISANPAAERILGLSFEQMQGKTSMDPRWQMIEEDGTPVPGTEHPATIALRTGQTVGPLIRGIYRPDKDSYNWLSITAIPLFQPGEKEPFQSYAVFEDITERKLSEETLKNIEWMLDPAKVVTAATKKDLGQQPYGDLSELNRARLIMDSVDPEVLFDTANEYLYLLETSTAIYEKNGDYALGIFTSGWCRKLDLASRNLCNTDDNLAALKSGKWLCHESCWKDASKPAIESGEPTDIECSGGIRLYSVPIFADNQVIGSINFGYGSPPRDPEKLKEIAEKYQVDIEKLHELAGNYEDRPPFIISLAKNRLHSSARLLGVLVERHKRGLELAELNEKLEQRVKERTIELEAVNKELEAFAYSVSHDLRAPLRALDGFSANLENNYADHLDKQGKHFIFRIRNASLRMSELIDDLLELSRITRTEIKQQEVDISHLSEEIFKELQEAEPGRRVEVEIAPGLTTRGDLPLLRAALENLLSNAWNFSSKKPQAKIEVGRTTRGGEKPFFVCDNGAGFDMAYADKLFGAFQRLHGKEEFPGTGIGLATVQRIINRHGGRIWAEAEVGKGATFYFTLER